MQIRINKLDAKNKEYLELFCGTSNTSSTNEATMPNILDLMKSGDGLINETSQEALALLEETLNDLAAKSA